MRPDIERLRIKIFADGADLESIRTAAKDRRISGFTTNPTLMRAAGVEDYKQFALQVLEIVPNRPVSFEVLADDLSPWPSRRAKSPPGAGTST